jgi:hypothetical protein
VLPESNRISDSFNTTYKIAVINPADRQQLGRKLVDQMNDGGQTSYGSMAYGDARGCGVILILVNQGNNLGWDYSNHEVFLSLCGRRKRELQVVLSEL